jgi:hypothetical protein
LQTSLLESISLVDKNQLQGTETFLVNLCEDGFIVKEYWWPPQPLLKQFIESRVFPELTKREEPLKDNIAYLLFQ